MKLQHVLPPLAPLQRQLLLGSRNRIVQALSVDPLVDPMFIEAVAAGD
jgi:hypothetical protein